MSAYSDLILAEPTLLHYWRLGDASFPLANEVGGGPSLEMWLGDTGLPTTGAPGLIAGDSDTALQFVGGTNRAVYASISYGPGATVEAWVKLDSLADCIVFTLGVSLGVDLSIVDGHLVGSGDSPEAPQEMATGVPYLLAVARDPTGTAGAQERLYVNGIEVASKPGNVGSGVQDFYIGSNAGFRAAPVGVVDEVAVYAGALPAERLRAHYLAGIGTYEFWGARV